MRSSGASLLVPLAAVFVVVAPIGCGDRGTKSCDIGTAGCPCIQATGCDPGLTCLSNRCVDTSPLRDAGAVSVTDGALAPSPSPAADGPAVAWTDAGGASNAGAASRDAAPPPVALPDCRTSGDCATGEVCGIKIDGTGVCLKGSGKACSSSNLDELCVRGEVFQRLSGRIEGSLCRTANDCRQAHKGHLNSVCLAREDNPSGDCALVCQYQEDPAREKCVTHPQLGLWSACTREQIRVYLAAREMLACGSFEVLGFSCVPNAPRLTTDESWTVDCIAGSTSCGGLLACFKGNSFSQKDARLFDFSLTDVVRFVRPVARELPRGSSGGKCGTDCDCGRCHLGAAPLGRQSGHEAEGGPS